MITDLDVLLASADDPELIDLVELLSSCPATCPASHAWEALTPGRYERRGRGGPWTGRYYSCPCCGTTMLRPGVSPGGRAPGGAEAAQRRTVRRVQALLQDRPAVAPAPRGRRRPAQLARVRQLLEESR